MLFFMRRISVDGNCKHCHCCLTFELDFKFKTFHHANEKCNAINSEKRFTSSSHGVHDTYNDKLTPKSVPNKLFLLLSFVNFLFLTLV